MSLQRRLVSISIGQYIVSVVVVRCDDANEANYDEGVSSVSSPANLSQQARQT
jgi:hypothetical protein